MYELRIGSNACPTDQAGDERILISTDHGLILAVYFAVNLGRKWIFYLLLSDEKAFADNDVSIPFFYFWSGNE